VADVADIVSAPTVLLAMPTTPVVVMVPVPEKLIIGKLVSLFEWVLLTLILVLAVTVFRILGVPENVYVPEKLNIAPPAVTSTQGKYTLGNAIVPVLDPENAVVLKYPALAPSAVTSSVDPLLMVVVAVVVRPADPTVKFPPAIVMAAVVTKPAAVVIVPLYSATSPSVVAPPPV
jgi:hypothetical protein